MWAFDRLRKKASPGVDNVTWEEYEVNLKGNLEDLVDRLKSKSYRARLIKRKYIPKINGKMRPLGIPVLEDKIIQLAVARILDSIFDGHFHDGSYGYRKNTGAKDAVDELKFSLTFGTFGYVVEADIKGFFDNIDHDWMLRMLEHRINDKAFIGLIRKWLKAGILDDGMVINPATGTPQGGIVSPVLANIYLHYALDLWFEKCIKPRCSGKCILVRYADDYVAAFQYKNEAEWFYQKQSERLNKFNLEIAPEKTNLIRFTRFIPNKGESFEFLGFSFQWRPVRSGKPMVSATTSKKKFTASVATFKEWIKSNRNKRVNVLMRKLKSKLQGYWNYYGIPGNSRALKSMFRQVYELLFKWLNRRSQRKSYTRWGLNDLLATFNVPKPCIKPFPYTHRRRLQWS
ncbi:MAG: group II intron reverse transcriptase/maturase [Planctomycetes bacterium]|nr:group II intron reverse transcriptase/maturase [Planctomycetota bacterium]